MHKPRAPGTPPGALGLRQEPSGFHQEPDRPQCSAGIDRRAEDNPQRSRATLDPRSRRGLGPRACRPRAARHDAPSSHAEGGTRLHRPDQHRLRRRVVGQRSVLLPGRPVRLHRPRVLRRAALEVRRPGRPVRTGGNDARIWPRPMVIWQGGHTRAATRSSRRACVASPPPVSGSLAAWRTTSLARATEPFDKTQRCGANPKRMLRVLDPGRPQGQPGRPPTAQPQLLGTVTMGSFARAHAPRWRNRQTRRS